MSLNDASFLLSSCYARAMNDAAPGERPGIRRAFRRALAALDAGELTPTVLLSYRYP